MAKIDKNKFVQDFQLKSFGAKGWLSSKLLPCPFCGGKDKFGVTFSENGESGVFHCFKCDKKGSLIQLFKAINREDLIVRGENNEYTLTGKIQGGLSIMQETEEDLSCPEIPKPLGFKPLETCEYLENRGWEPWQLKQYHAGTTLDPNLKNKITFLLYEDHKLIGYLSRSTHSKEWHKRNLEDFKKGKCPLVLRYDNSRATPFEKVVGGIDEITNQTQTVILVEGIMDKANTDKVLHLSESPEVKCCFTFGCKLSEAQMLKIYNKGVRQIILCYDPGTIQQVKTTSLKLSKKFDIKIGELKGTKDPGEMNIWDFEEIFVNLVSPIEYYANRLQTDQLKR